MAPRLKMSAAVVTSAFLPGRLFGRDKAGTAEDGFGHGEPGVVFEQLGQTEVGQMRFAVGVDDDVVRFEVPVQDAVLVGVMDGMGEGRDDARAAFGGKRAIGEFPVEAAAVDPAHAEERLAGMFPDLVDRHDVRVFEVGGRLGFQPETSAEMPGRRTARAAASSPRRCGSG